MPPRFMTGQGDVIGSMRGRRIERGTWLEQKDLPLASSSAWTKSCMILVVRAGANLLMCWNTTRAIVCSAKSRSLCAFGREEEKEKSISLRSNSAVSLVGGPKKKTAPFV